MSAPSRRQADVSFCKDFFFTDIMNHLEFLKWTGTLEKNDDILLIEILERLASPERLLKPMQEPYFYGTLGVEHCTLPKNALHVAKAYSQIQRLAAMDFNIFEYAYLDPAAYQGRAVLAFLIQLGFFSSLVIYNIFENRIEITPDEDGFGLVVGILFMSSALLFSEITRQSSDARDFNSVMLDLGQIDTNTAVMWSLVKRRKVWLHVNYAINCVLGIFVFFFNIYFILVSDDPTSAVLNSVALAFIIEVDDAFMPRWKEANKEDALAEMLQHYIMDEEGPDDDIDIRVTGDNDDILKGDHKVYIYLEDYEDVASSFGVKVFVADAKDPETNATISYKTVYYYIAGTRSKELYESFSNFNCLENLEDITQSYQAGSGEKSHGIAHQTSAKYFDFAIKSRGMTHHNSTTYYDAISEG